MIITWIYGSIRMPVLDITVSPFLPEHVAIVVNLALKLYRKAGEKKGTASIVKEPWYHQTWCDYSSMIKWKRQENKWSFDYTDFDK